MVCGPRKATFAHPATSLPSTHDRGRDVQRSAPVRDLTIGGFPAKENLIRLQSGPPPTCDVAVDVAPGQTLEASYTKDSGTKPPFLTAELLCKRAAEAAIATLMSKD